MTFCLGIRVAEGIVALSDTQIVRGEQVSRKAKLSTLTSGGHEAILMTSGLRSVRDKVALRLEDDLTSRATAIGRMHELASAFGDELRAVRAEDAPSLEASGLAFNMHAIVGGRMSDDREPELMQIYPEGTWVHATPDAPYLIVGRSYYGKPILDRLLRFEAPLDDALSLAYLAFDATRASVNDVDFPIDVAVLRDGEATFTQSRFDVDELTPLHDWWQARLRSALDDMPTTWASPLLAPRRTEVGR